MKTLQFDYIVVGGGSSGCVVAARLAAESGGSVLLLERGRADKNRWIHIPATFFKALQSQDAEALTSEPDASLDGLRFVVPQGKVLGGGSSVNGMIYMRGQARDYDDWNNVYGCTGWAYEDVLPVFKRQEANQQFDNAYHGVAGKLIVDAPANPHSVSKRIIDAAVSIGIPRSYDFNGASQEGAGWYQVTVSNGKRQSASTCFLNPELKRENLHILSEHTVNRIVFKSRKAIGVEATNSLGENFLINAKKEIVLTAGSFQTPKLLMLSGIGPRDELVRYGIDIVHESNDVGRHYQDHVGTPVTRYLKKPIGLHGADKGLKAFKHGIDYFVFGRGLLTSNLLEAGACVDTSGMGRPDVQFNFAPFAPGAPGSPPLADHAVQIHPMTMRPASRGRLGLNSADPLAQPKFYSSVLDKEEDMEVLRRGVRLAREMFDAAELKDVVREEIWPGNSIISAVGSNSLDDAIRAQARTIYHPAGTCRMGPSEDSVVDLQLRVRGVTGLRLADCSVMPSLVSGNTNAPVMMIADRAADWILQDI